MTTPERAPGSGKLIRGATGDWEVVVGMEVHAQVISQSKLFSGASTAFGGAPNSHVSLVDAAMPGMLPVINRECVAQAVRTGLGLKAADQPEEPLRPQELLLSGPAAGLSDLAVPAADRRRGRGHRRPRRRRQLHGRHRAAASGAGRGQVDPRPAPDVELRRSQPLRRGADGDRLEARHPLVRRGQGLSHQAALDPALSRHLRRQHGRGLAQGRRQRLGAQARRAARHALRDQEHELDPLHRRGDRLRGAPPDRHPRGWRQRSTRRPAGSIPDRGETRVDALQGRGARLPLFPRSRPAAAGVRAGLGGRARRRPAGTAGRARRRASSPIWASAPTMPVCSPPNARLPTISRRWPRAATPRRRPTG